MSTIRAVPNRIDDCSYESRSTIAAWSSSRCLILIETPQGSILSKDTSGSHRRGLPGRSRMAVAFGKSLTGEREVHRLEHHPKFSPAGG